MSPWLQDQSSSEGSQDVPSQEPIAIVGMACRFPGEASNPEKFWDMLTNGPDAWSEFPSDRFEAKAHYHPDPDRKDSHNVKGAHFIKGDIAAFDAPFFSFSTNESNAMDPGQRVLLEVTYEGFENAGIPIDNLQGSQTGVYVGVMTHDYASITGRDPDSASLYSTTGNHAAILANRVSWFFDLQGPSITLDTACSSSAVCLHLASQALQSGEIDIGVVGGVSILIDPEPFVSMTSLHMISPDGRSKSFDQRADGYGRGEGVAAVILKRLDDAIRDGDTIRAIVRGTGVGQDGRTPGITLPSTQAQANLIRQVYERAGLSLDDTEFFEAHGTGTPAGDPLEMSAIATTFGAAREPELPLHVGSVKSQIGHLEGCSGLAGLIKAVHSLEKGIIAPNHDFQTVNERIPLSEWNLKIPTAALQWPKQGLRRISLSNYGFGGTNSHAVFDDAYHFLRARGLRANHNTSAEPQSLPALQEPRADTDTAVNGSSLSDPSMRLFLLSSHEQDGISRQANSLAEWAALQPHFDDETSANLAYTLSSRRSALPWRSFVVATGDLKDRLKEDLARPIRAPGVPKLAWVFTGQGAQWPTMGKELMSYSVFAESINSAETYMNHLGADWSLTEELWKPDEFSMISQPRLSQPLCTAVQVALIDLVRSWGEGLKATSVVGHSSGEIAAAYYIGALSRESAWRAAYHRGRLSQQVQAESKEQPTGMTAVGLGEDGVRAYLQKLELSSESAIVACINSPSSVTVAGRCAALQILEAALESDKIFARRLKVEVAYHSPIMSQIADEYRASLADLSSGHTDGSTKMFSSVTGQEVTVSELDSEYWVRNMLSPVQFTQAVTSMLTNTGKKRRRRVAASRIDILVECGPAAALQGPLKQITDSLPKENESSLYLSLIQRNKDANETLLSAIGRLWSKGVQKLDFLAINRTISGEQMSQDPVLQKKALKHRQPKVLTNLPPYAWNHSKTYWNEGRNSRSTRFRKHPRLDWVGARVPQTLDPTWKNFVRAVEQPWLRDHKVQGTMLFPAAAMLVGIVEALKQTADPDDTDRTLLGFELRDVRIGRALVVPSADDGVEVLTTLKPSTAPTTESETWFDFTMRSVANEGEYAEHCTGSCRLVYENRVSELDQSHNEPELVRQKRKMHDISEKCVDPMATRKLNDCFDRIGLNFGPLFRNIRGIKCTEGAATFSTVIPATKNVMPLAFEQEHTIHPATLDTFFQAVLSTGSSYIDLIKDPLVPTGIGRLFIAAQQVLDTDPSDFKYSGFATASLRGSRNLVAPSIVAFDEQQERLCVVIENFEMTSLAIPGMAQREDPRKVCSELVWRPAYSLMDSEQKRAALPQRIVDDELVDFITRSGNKLVAIYLDRALSKVDSSMIGERTEIIAHAPESEKAEEVDTEPTENEPSPDEGAESSQEIKIVREEKPHLKLYYEWAKAYAEAHSKSELPEEFSSEEELIERSVVSAPDGRILDRIANHLVEILENRIDPLQVMFDKDMLLIEFYRESEGCKQLNDYMATMVDTMTFENPRADIMEIGAGTGGTTKAILNKIGGSGSATARWGSYTFTDVTPFALKNCQEEFADWNAAMQFRTFDAETSFEEQEYEAASYDIILASNVIHALKNIDEALQNVQRLLRPGGVFLLGEFTKTNSLMQAVFGTLPQWWAGELAGDYRNAGPGLDSASWIKALERNGFIDPLEFFDFEKESHRCNTLFVSRKPAVPVARAERSEAIILIDDQVSADVQQIGNAISHHLDALDYSVKKMTLAEAATEVEQEAEPDDANQSADDVPSDENGDPKVEETEKHKPIVASEKLCVSLLEVGNHALAGCDQTTFEAFQRLIRPGGCSSLFTITNGVEVDSLLPHAMATKGFLRSVRGENPDRRFTTVDLEHKSLLTSPLSNSGNMNCLSRILNYHLSDLETKDKDPVLDSEFAVREGLIQVPRLSPEVNMNNKMSQLGALPATEECQLLQIDTNLRLQVALPGQLESLRFEQFDVPALAADEVRVRVRAVSLSHRDTLRALGEVDLEGGLGDDAAGTIEAVGQDVKSLSVGDRVAVIAASSFATTITQKESLVQTIAEDMSFEKVAANIAALNIAYAAVMKRGMLEAGDTILIHSAASSVGQLCIQLAQTNSAAKIFATVSSTEKRDLLCERYHLAPQHVFDSTSAKFSRTILELTQGAGVDVIVGSMPNHLLQETWNCLSSFGRYVYLGTEKASHTQSSSMRNNQTLTSFDMRHNLVHQPRKAAQLFKESFECLRSGQVAGLQPVSTYSWANVKEALTQVGTRENASKFVLIPQPADAVPVVPADKHATSLDANATYLISGLGGLGRSIALHLVSKGARHIVFLSRSGAKAETSKALIDNIRGKGVQVEAFACDISNASTLESTLREISSSMPPIKGVLQLASSMQDALTSKMTYEQWTASTRPKIEGSWNLHKLLPQDGSLNFFILFSSIAGVSGNRGQGNYAAGNAFMDALAHHRRANRLPAVSLDLPAISDVGWIADNEAEIGEARRDQMIHAAGAIFINETELHALLDMAISGYSTDDNPVPTQIISSATGGYFLAKGTDHPFWTADARFGVLMQDSVKSRSASAVDADMPKLSKLLPQATSLTAAADLILSAMVIKIARGLGVAQEDVDLNKPLHSYGVDSLVAVELRDWVWKEARTQLSVFDLLANEPLRALAEKVVKKSELVSKEVKGEV